MHLDLCLTCKQVKYSDKMARSVNSDNLENSGRAAASKIPDSETINQAKRQVRFSLVALNEILPGEKNQADTDLRRRSRRRASLPIPEQADIQIERRNEEDEHDDSAGRAIGESLEEFDRVINASLESYRYTTTPEGLEQDIEEKLEQLAVLYSRKGKIEFPFRALTEDGQNTTTVKGNLDYNGWCGLVKKDPQAMFQEMKIRSLQVIAYKELMEQVHLCAVSCDANMYAVYSWAKKFANFLGERQNTDHTDLMMREMNAKDIEIEELSKIIADNARKMSKQEKRIKDLTNKRDDFPSNDSDSGTSKEFLSDKDNHSRRRHKTPDSRCTHGTNRSSKSGGSTSMHKNIKIDVPIFRNESKDELSFDFWYRMIENKLKVNGHHFDSDEAKRVYIESRVQGQAGENLLPYLSHDHPDRIRTSEGLLKHLWTEYHNHHRRVNALNDFNDLLMEPGNDFTTFRNAFVRLAGECRRPRDEWKEEFHRRMLPSMMDKLAREVVDDKVGFEEYARVAAQLALNYEQTQKSKKKREKTGTSTATSDGKGKRSKLDKDRRTDAAASTSNTKITTKLSENEIKQLAREGRCFNCKEKGHIGVDCPKKKTDREARIAAIAAKYNQHDETKSKKKKHKQKVDSDADDDSDSTQTKN